MNSETLEQYYYCGGTLPLGNKTYVARKADTELYEFVQRNHQGNRVCFVLAPRQMGKSSLMVSVGNSLSQHGINYVSINLHRLGGKESVSSETLWQHILAAVCESLPGSSSLREKQSNFWFKNVALPPNQRFFDFLSQEILFCLINKKLVIFLDEVQALVSYNLQDEFLNCIRAVSDDVSDELLRKLCFVLVGVAKPSDLSSQRETSLNIGTQIELGFLEGECLPLQIGLAKITDDVKGVFSRIFFWTSGQPFLTQALCNILVQNAGFIPKESQEEYVDLLVRNLLINQWRKVDPQSHFQEIEKHFLVTNEVRSQLQALSCYYSILEGSNVFWDRNNEIHADLLSSGLVSKIVQDQLILLSVSNPIYKEIFNKKWIYYTRCRLIANRVPAISAVENIYSISDTDFTKQCLRILWRGLYPFIEFVMVEWRGLEWKNFLDQKEFYSNLGQLDYLTCEQLLEVLTSENCWKSIFNRINLNPQVKHSASEVLKFSTNKAEYKLSTQNFVLFIEHLLVLLQAVGAERDLAKLDEIKMNKLRDLGSNDTQSETKTVLEFIHTDDLPVTKDSKARDLANNTEAVEAVSVTENLIDAKNLEISRNRLNMDRAAQISKLKEKRRPQAEKASRVLANLSTLSSSVDALEVCRDKTLQRIEDIVVRERLQDLHFGSIRDKIRNVRNVVERLHERFARETLTIAFVGRAGQGKSRFIQSLTGLTSAEVPDGGINNCTGVKCTISHLPGVEPYAEVIFHDRNSFFESNIIPYYELLGLAPNPTNLQDFVHNPLPELTVPGAEAKSYYAHLVKCHSNYSSYEVFLDEGVAKRVSRSEIRKFVAQTDESNQRSYFNYLAVKEVKIFCTFPYGDVGQVSLIDLPGLGDTVLGDRERIRRSLGHDVDFALFVYMPQGTRVLQEEHYKLYDTANAALTELPIAKWSFMVLNHVTSSQLDGVAANLGLCNEIKSRIETEQRIKVLRCLIADCTSKGSASEVLDQVLDQLDNNLLNLDSEYASVGNTAIKNLQAEFNLFLDRARQAFAVSPVTENETKRFRKLFEEFTRGVNRKLYELLKDIRPKNLDTLTSQEEDNFFKLTITDIIQKCYEDTGIPTEEELLDRYLDPGSGGLPGIFAACLDELRTHIRSNFSSVDNGLKDYVDTIKTKVAEVFTQTPLENLTPARGADFIKFMSEEISPSEQSLKGAFSRLYSFEMSYRTNFQYRILKALEELDPNRNAKLLSTPSNKTNEQICHSIHEILTVLHRAAICACQEALEKFEGEPSLAAYAAVDEFVDEIARGKGAKDQWYDFLRERSSQIWVDEFGQKVKEEKKEWAQLVDKAVSINKFEVI